MFGSDYPTPVTLRMIISFDHRSAVTGLRPIMRIVLIYQITPRSRARPVRTDDSQRFERVRIDTTERLRPRSRCGTELALELATEL